MSKRYRILIGGSVAALLVAVGGLAFAAPGGQSGDHRQNPTTTTGDTTTTTTTTLAADTTPKAESDTEGSDVESQSNRTAALCHALHQGSERGQAMKAEHGQAFQNLECNNVAPLVPDDESEGTDEGTNESGGPPENSNAGGNGGGQGQGNDNPHAANGQSHKP
jgi:hypothetical protein